jgi:hypothetical protein
MNRLHWSEAEDMRFAKETPFVMHPARTASSRGTRFGGLGGHITKGVHGLGGLLGGLALCCLGFPPKCGLNSVGDARGENVRPLMDCPVSRSNLFSGGGDSSAEARYGKFLVHPSIEP